MSEIPNFIPPELLQRSHTVGEFYAHFPGIGRDARIQQIVNDLDTGQLWLTDNEGRIVYELGGEKHYSIEVIDAPRDSKGSGGRLYGVKGIEDITGRAPVLLTDLDSINSHAN
jgi:hypothetical protein